MESLITYTTEHGLVYPTMMALVILSSILAGIVFYYRMTYGTVQKCRFCLSVGKHTDILPGEECPKCGHAHLRKDHWSKFDGQRLADYKARYYAAAQAAKERQKREAIEKEKREREAAEQRRLAVQKEEAEKQRLAEQEAAEQQRLADEERARDDDFRRVEMAMIDDVYPGQVVLIRRNRVKARRSNDNRLLAPGDLIQVDEVSFAAAEELSRNGHTYKGYHRVYYRRHQGHSKSHYLPLIDVEPARHDALLPGRFARVLKTALHTPDILDPNSPLKVGTIIRINNVNCNWILKGSGDTPDWAPRQVDYKTAHGVGYATISVEWLQLVIDPVDYIEPGDTVRVVRNEVGAKNPASTKSHTTKLKADQEIIVNSVQRDGTDGWPYKHMDVITYRCDISPNGLNYLPVYDVALVEKWYDAEVKEAQQGRKQYVSSVPGPHQPISTAPDKDECDHTTALNKWWAFTCSASCLGEGLAEKQYVGLAKSVSSDGFLRIAYYDETGVLREARVKATRAKKLCDVNSSYNSSIKDKITREWTEKFYVPSWYTKPMKEGCEARTADHTALDKDEFGSPNGVIVASCLGKKLYVGLAKSVSSDGFISSDGFLTLVYYDEDGVIQEARVKAANKDQIVREWTKKFFPQGPNHQAMDDETLKELQEIYDR